MANCHDLFNEYHDKIKINSDKKESLRKSRDAVRDKIKKYFKDTKGVTAPKFHGQGSYMMGTIITPLDGEYDIDDGVYLQHLEEDESKWPATSTMHTWIVNAVKGHTSTEPVDKNTCVRVIYKNHYHIDLPIYVIKDDVPRLAHKSKGWINSDPRAFTDWFRSTVKENGEQLRQIVKYLKAWADYKNQNASTKMPSGIMLTILAAENFVGSDGRDDEALVGTVRNILDTLEESFSCKKPVEPNEDLFEDWSDTRKDNFLNKLNTLCDKGNKALELENDKKEEASLKWQDLLGDRFPKYENVKEEQSESAYATTAPAALYANNGRSA
mgnify:CR=1 FL=1